MTDEKLLRWIWLTTVTTIGSYTPHRLLHHFSSVEAVYEADEEAYRQVSDLRKEYISPLLNKSLDKAKEIGDYCRAYQVGVVTPDDYCYPQRLKTMLNYPLVLYYFGTWYDFDALPCVAMVGPRKMSPYGEAATKRIGVDLATSGVLIVSGLAEGVDGLAHKAALYAGGKTVGILGCGIDRIYPASNKELYLQMYQRGLVVSEFPPGTAPMARNFPIRNRIISGLSCAVLVVEAGESSGSLITADYALKQKRLLFTVPGSIFSANALGSNHLFRVGAMACMSYVDIAEALRQDFPHEILLRPKAVENKKRKAASSDKEYLPSFDRKKRPLVEKRLVKEPAKKNAETVNLSSEEKSIFDLLSYEPVLADNLVGEDRSVAQVMRILSMLELKGVVCACPGNRFMKED
ncbi:MAG TPA: DNA-protecting protein DprA [Clostridiales bacterium]|nr:DNA-protecting protein DprA [Clostridiales bacterium]HCG35046.1 DNA-protecting protein DprA [Clostridiales bacterium]